MNDLTPQSKWKRRRAAALAWWSRTQFRRNKAVSAFVSVLRRLVTLAISVVGGTLISYGVWTIFEPAGFIVGGILLWAIQWNHEAEGDR